MLSYSGASIYAQRRVSEVDHRLTNSSDVHNCLDASNESSKMHYTTRLGDRETQAHVNYKCPTCDAHVFHKKVAEAIPPELKPAIDPLLSAIATLTERISAADARIEALGRERYPETTVLRQVP